MGICQGQVVIVTGAGRGIGRAHAEAFARQGAKVVVNDFGGQIDGSSAAEGPAEEVAAAIRASGGEAIGSSDDVASPEGAKNLVWSAVETFGRLDVVVNNAGILRDNLLVRLTPEEWDAVLRVHAGGTFLVMREAASYWREQHKEGRPPSAAVINTSSTAGLYGNIGQTNYSAAKAAIVAMSLVAAAELKRYDVTVNVLCPVARTRMTEALFPDMMAAPEAGFDVMNPGNMSPLVAWLASAEARSVTGRVFSVIGGRIILNTGWTVGPSVDKGERWDPAEIGPAIGELLAQAPEPVPVIGT